MSLSPQQELALGIKVATDAHYGQTDKGGNPYILHPIFLMTQLLHDPQLATIAVMHDVLEDSDITKGELLDMGFSIRVIVALDLLHHKSHDDYETYVKLMLDNLDVIIVKMLDLDHNSRITRLKGVGERDLVRIAKYHKAYVLLERFKRKFQ